LTGGAESRDRSKISISISFIFFLVIARYTSAFGYSAAQAAAPGQDSALAGWLVAHGLRATVDSGARVESAQALPCPAVRATFGRPARSYRFDGHAVLVWNVNLLTRMGE
jgi:hypothetical protein